MSEDEDGIIAYLVAFKWLGMRSSLVAKKEIMQK